MQKATHQASARSLLDSTHEETPLPTKPMFTSVRDKQVAPVRYGSSMWHSDSRWHNSPRYTTGQLLPWRGSVVTTCSLDSEDERWQRTSAHVSSPRVQPLGNMPESAVLSQLRHQIQVDRRAFQFHDHSPPHVHSAWQSPYLWRCGDHGVARVLIPVQAKVLFPVQPPSSSPRGYSSSPWTQFLHP